MATKSQISTLEDGAVETAVAASKPDIQRARPVDGGSGKYELLTIYSGTESDGNDAVPLGLGGYLYRIPRNKPYLVPVEVANILRESVTRSYSNEGGNQVALDRPRYAFSAVPE